MSATFSREKAELSVSDKVYYFLSAFFMIFSILVYTYPSMYMLHKLYVYQLASIEVKDLLVEQNRLKLEYEMLMTHESVETLASESGFREPHPRQIVYVKGER